VIEVLTGCETENKYKIYPANESGARDSSREIFTAKEKSSCLQRQCCPGNCRAFDLNVT